MNQLLKAAFQLFNVTDDLKMVSSQFEEPWPGVIRAVDCGKRGPGFKTSTSQVFFLSSGVRGGIAEIVLCRRIQIENQISINCNVCGNNRL